MDGGFVAYARRSARLVATHDPRGSRRVVRECAQGRINPRVETMSFTVSAASGAAVANAKSARPGESGFSRRGSRGGVAKTRATRRALGASRAARGVRRGLVVANDAGQDAYNKAMQEYSKTPFEYRHELGLYYHSILPNLIVGTQPQTKEDIDRLHDVEGVTCMFDTQQFKDKEHWNVDFGAIKYQMDQRGVRHEHHPFVDFSADSLREGLPKAVAAMDKVLREGHVVYCHCTAGMGRSPGVAIAYLYWCLNFDNLDQAYDFLTSKRPCGPKKESIRAATVDMLAAHGESMPNQMVDSAEPAGMNITEEERWDIVTKLRRSYGDDPEECLLSPIGTAKKIFGMPLTTDDCA